MELQVIKSEILSADFQSKWIEQSGTSIDVFKKEASFALQQMGDNPYLLKCDKSSILKSVLNIAQTGLTLNPIMNYAALVPRKKNNQLQCVLDPMYQGLVKLLTDAGSVTSIECNIIYDGDDVVFDYASQSKIVKHVPYFLVGNEKGEIRAVYSIATYADGNIHAEIMSAADINEIRDKSEAYKAYKVGKVKSTPWNNNYGEMARKTVIKRHFKYLSKTENVDKLNKAIQLDNYAHGYDDDVNYQTIGYAESLIETSSLTPEQREKCYNELGTIKYQSSVVKMIGYLKQNQIDPRDANITTEKQANEALDRSIELDKD